MKPDSGESGVDCGGDECERCAVGDTCRVARDCRDGHCVNGFCQHPLCANALLDGDESDVDCGGSLCLGCSAGSACDVSADCASKVCDAARCAEPSCDDGVHNGEELDVDCGAGDCAGCPGGILCTSANQCESARCEDGRCATACAAGSADCDRDFANGCETNALTDAEHCGGCGQRCTFANAGARCEDGVCALGECEPPFADCNADPTDGCEADLERDALNCSACSVACSTKNAAAACSGGTCALTCDPGFDDCDKDAETGCEVSLLEDPENCGHCGTSCEHSPDEVASCREGVCGIMP